MSFRYEFRLSGSASQGLNLAGKILTEAPAIYDGKNATCWQSYGSEARSSLCRSEVIISDALIEYPKAVRVDFLLAFMQEAFDKYYKDVKPNGVILVDSVYVTDILNSNSNIYSLPITKIAEKEGSKKLIIPIAALGMITEIAKVISKDAIKSAILLHGPKGTEEINLKAFKVGINAVQRLKYKRNKSYVLEFGGSGVS